MVWRSRKSLGTTLFFLVSTKIIENPNDNLMQHIQNRYLPLLIFILDLYCMYLFLSEARDLINLHLELNKLIELPQRCAIPFMRCDSRSHFQGSCTKSADTSNRFHNPFHIFSCKFYQPFSSLLDLVSVSIIQGEPWFVP